MCSRKLQFFSKDIRKSLDLWSEEQIRSKFQNNSEHFSIKMMPLSVLLKDITQGLSGEHPQYVLSWRSGQKKNSIIIKK